MRKGGASAKGSAFERDMCKRLSLWLTKGRRNDLLWRNSMSGGRSTITLKQTGRGLKAQAGDIGMIDTSAEDFVSRYAIECKHYKDLNIPALLFGSKVGILTFWEQAQRDAESVDKQPLLIARQNRYPIIIGMRVVDARNFFMGEPKFYEIARFHQHNLVLFKLDTFLDEATLWWCL